MNDNDIEKEINTAIKGLTRRVNLKSDHIFILENALANSQVDTLTNNPINNEIWQQSLNGNNTRLALQQNIYTAEMVKLLTLRAIILPDTLPEFLDWLQQGKGKNQEQYQHSLNFQINFRKNLSENTPYLLGKINEGVRLIIIELVNKPHLLNMVIWLLKSEDGLWGKAYQNDVRISLENLLAFIIHFPENTSNFQLFTDEEYQYIRQEKKIKIIRKYKVLGDLFAQLDDKSIPLSLFFYQLSCGKVPSKIYQKLKPTPHKIFSLEIKENLNFIQKIIRNISNFRLKNLNFFRKEMLYCLGRMIMWWVIFIICGNINETLIALPMIANLPLVSFYLIGVILAIYTDLFLMEWDYINSYDYDFLMQVSFIFYIIILPYLLNYIYRYVIFKNKKIGFRIAEFFIWLIPFIIMTAIFASLSENYY